MGLFRKALFLGTAVTGTPLVRWNNSAEAAAKEQRRLMQEQNAILADLAKSQSSSQIAYPVPVSPRHSAPAASSRTTPRAAPHVASTPPSPSQIVPAAEPSLTDRLSEIKGLLDRGIITAEEHAAMRKKVLGL